MTATQTKLRRGTNTQCDAMTPAEAEVVVDLTNDRLRLGDGTTPGGLVIPNYNDIQKDLFVFAVAAGTPNAITVTIAPAPTLAQPLRIRFKATNTNTAATTIAINGGTAKNIQKLSIGALTDLVAGDIVSGCIYEIVYDGVQFQIFGLSTGGILSVGQGDLRTATGSASLAIGGTGSNYLITMGTLNAGTTVGAAPRFGLATTTGASFGSTGLPAGDYGFIPAIGRSGAGGANAAIAYQMFITSSPPFDLGDGDAGGFIFLLLESNGDIASSYLADVPPWAYNGPTRITADYFCPISKKKFRKVMKKRSLDEIMDGAKIEYKLEEITQKIKNADMKLIPHPFYDKRSDQKVIMLDPMDEKLQRLIEYQNAGGGPDIHEAICAGHLQIDNDPITRKCPKGVHVSRMKFRNSRNG